jgi:hypothetical protein
MAIGVPIVAIVPLPLSMALRESARAFTGSKNRATKANLVASGWRLGEDHSAAGGCGGHHVVLGHRLGRAVLDDLRVDWLAVDGRLLQVDHEVVAALDGCSR